MNPAIWFEIYVQDMPRAQKFYEAVLGLKLQPLPTPGNGPEQMMAFPMDMSSVGASGALVKMSGMKSGGNSTIIYFASQDCAIEEARVATAGGRVQQPKVSIGDYGFISLAVDTEGNIFGLHSRP